MQITMVVLSCGGQLLATLDCTAVDVVEVVDASRIKVDLGALLEQIGSELLLDGSDSAAVELELSKRHRSVSFKLGTDPALVLRAARALDRLYA